DRYFDAIVKRGGHPGVKSTAGRTSHTNALRVHVFPSQKILQRNSRFVHCKALLGHSYQQAFNPPMIPPGNTPFTLTEWIEIQDNKSKLGHIDAKRLEIGTGLAVREPMPVVEDNRWSSAA
ncbi:MAG: hypothetical protein WKF37_20830, partial [Bryobacteraceae bacterium]